MTLSMLALITYYWYAECHKQTHYAICHYTECHYAECCYPECHGTIDVTDWIFIDKTSQKITGKTVYMNNAGKKSTKPALS